MTREDLLISLLNQEVIQAEGCTEPIALAFCAAKLTEVLGGIPDRVSVYASGNIIKNVKSVTVPNSEGMIGIKPAVAMGLVAGDPNKELMVISGVKKPQLVKVNNYLNEDTISIFRSDKKIKLYIKIEGYLDRDKVVVELKYTHTNITLIQKNKEIIYKQDLDENKKILVDEVIKSFSIHEIYKLGLSLDVSKVKELFDIILDNNSNISIEGLKHDYGAKTGKSIKSAIDLGFYGSDVRNNAAAIAAAGSDARMAGSALPVMTVAGSGNVGITISMALDTFYKFRELDRACLYKAMFVAILITVYIKSRIGRLSALCSPTCSSAGIAAGILLMLDQPTEIVDKGITNALAGIVGVMCDGANSSCSIKIANSIYAAYDAVNLAMLGNTVKASDGLIGDDIEETIDNIVYIATDTGMAQTDVDILNIMLRN